MCVCVSGGRGAKSGMVTMEGLSYDGKTRHRYMLPDILPHIHHGAALCALLG